MKADHWKSNQSVDGSRWRLVSYCNNDCYQLIGSHKKPEPISSIINLYRFYQLSSPIYVSSIAHLM